MRAAVELALPRECAGCGRPERGLCRACLRTFGDPVRCEESTQHLAGAGSDAALPTWALADYAGAARHAVLAWKSGGRPDLAAPLTALIARAATAIAAELGALEIRDRLAVVPAPSGAARRRSGRFVVGELADAAGAGLAATLGIEVLVIDPLRRRASTDHLLGAAARRDDRAGSVRCLTALPGLSCLIVDDVVTTGATLAASAGALAGAGARPVAALVLARTPPPGAAVRDLQPRADGGPVV